MSEARTVVILGGGGAVWSCAVESRFVSSTRGFALSPAAFVYRVLGAHILD